MEIVKAPELTVKVNCVFPKRGERRRVKSLLVSRIILKLSLVFKTVKSLECMILGL